MGKKIPLFFQQSMINFLTALAKFLQTNITQVFGLRIRAQSESSVLLVQFNASLSLDYIPDLQPSLVCLSSAYQSLAKASFGFVISGSRPS